jgi:hypothetical protein
MERIGAMSLPRLSTGTRVLPPSCRGNSQKLIGTHAEIETRCCSNHSCSTGTGVAAKKLTGTVILRSQRATKNLHWLGNTECRSFAPKGGPQNDGVRSVFPQPFEPGTVVFRIPWRTSTAEIAKWRPERGRWGVAGGGLPRPTRAAGNGTFDPFRVVVDRAGGPWAAGAQKRALAHGYSIKTPPGLRTTPRLRSAVSSRCCGTCSVESEVVFVERPTTGYPGKMLKTNGNEMMGVRIRQRVPVTTPALSASPILNQNGVL